MLFDIIHQTGYRYGHPAAEAYVEARLAPPDTLCQKVLKHELVISPVVETSAYEDHFGNHVDFFSLPYRHTGLDITSSLRVETHDVQIPGESLEVSIQEAHQIFAHQIVGIYPFLQFSEVVTAGREAGQWARRFFQPGTPIGKASIALCEAIYSTFEYRSGSTTNSTPLAEVWKKRRGVCQDFAHIALSVLRSARIPSRYVCGYIETDPPQSGDESNSQLVGSAATHAWVEVLLPGRIWLGIDPTNNQTAGVRHVAMSYGRDFREAAPLKGTFKGSGGQIMKIRVRMKRRKQPRKS